MSESAEKLYEEREKRVNDAIALRTPDRVPILVLSGYFPAKYSGMTVENVMYDHENMFKSQLSFTVDFQPDMGENPYSFRCIGPLLDTLDYKALKWPGRGLGPDVTYQFVEGEYMKADEYDALLSDPLDFIMRRYWPRVCGALKGFEKLPPLHNIISYYMGMPYGFGAFSLSEVAEALESLKKAGTECMKNAEYAQRFVRKAKEEGFPMQAGALGHAPFDTLGDFFRGTRGLMIDMHRQPDKVLMACEKILPLMFEMSLSAAKATGNGRVFIPLHKGPEGFMSNEQFKKFYWPTLRDLMFALIDEGLTPCPLIEGDYTSRLDIIKDVPPGKACYAFEATDMIRAKEVLGDRVCIRGNVPLSLLATGNPDDVRSYCKKLIDTAGKDGGFIMDASTVIDDAKVENVRAMFDYTREYGVY
jgi:hypothetical protein